MLDVNIFGPWESGIREPRLPLSVCRTTGLRHGRCDHWHSESKGGLLDNRRMSDCAIRSIALTRAPAVFAGVLIISLLVTALLVSTGILVSLRSPTVRQASQTVSVIVVALVLAPAGLSQLAPAEWIKAIVDSSIWSGWWRRASWWQSYLRQ